MIVSSALVMNSETHVGTSEVLMFSYFLCLCVCVFIYLLLEWYMQLICSMSFVLLFLVIPISPGKKRLNLPKTLPKTICNNFRVKLFVMPDIYRKHTPWFPLSVEKKVTLISANHVPTVLLIFFPFLNIHHTLTATQTAGIKCRQKCG